jgi:hypothetical protein
VLTPCDSGVDVDLSIMIPLRSELGNIVVGIWLEYGWKVYCLDKRLCLIRLCFNVVRLED